MIRFQQIDERIAQECIRLQVSKEQRWFVADNERSLQEAALEKGLYPLAIYAQEQMVGFLLYDYDETIPGWSLSRFMIGEHQQGKGYGTQAVKAFLAYMRRQHHPQRLYVSVSLDNQIAYHVYKRIGFQECGEVSYVYEGREFHEKRMVIKL